MTNRVSSLFRFKDFIPNELQYQKYIDYCLVTAMLLIVTFWLCKNLWLISKLMTSQTGQQTIAIQILPNISRSHVNQIMKFYQLIEYNKQNIFLEISYIKCGG